MLEPNSNVKVRRLAERFGGNATDAGELARERRTRTVDRGGVAGRVLGSMLGGPRQQTSGTRRTAPKVQPAATLAPATAKEAADPPKERVAKLSAAKPAATKPLLAKAATKALAAREGKEKSSKGVNALKLTGEAALRSASPCSPEPSTDRPAKKQKAVAKQAKTTAQAKVQGRGGGYGGGKAGSDAQPTSDESSSDESEQKPSSDEEEEDSSDDSDSGPAAPPPATKRQIPAPAAAPPSAKKRKAGTAAAVAAASTAPEPAAASEREAGTAAVPKAAPPGEFSFQEIVLERVKTLCGDHDDAKVLAEYIVVMVSGHRSREDMAGELKPFFQDQVQAEEFVEWVEAQKYRFLTGHAPAQSSAAVPKAEGSAPSNQSRRPASNVLPVDFWGAPVRPPPPATQSQPSRQAAGSVTRGQHVAVTNKIRLSPNPEFDEDKGQQASRGSTVAAFSKAAVAAARAAQSPLAKLPSPLAGSPQPQAASPPAASPVKREQLLEKMTKQLQEILAKLNDKSLNDETREKYQALAQSIQTNVAKITKPQAPKRR